MADEDDDGRDRDSLDNGTNLFPHFPNADPPLPEDYVRQSLPYGKDYIEQMYLEEAYIDPDAQDIEAPSMIAPRKERLIYLGRQIASVR